MALPDWRETRERVRHPFADSRDAIAREMKRWETALETARGVEHVRISAHLLRLQEMLDAAE